MQATGTLTKTARGRTRLLTAATMALALITVGTVGGTAHRAAAAGAQVTYQAGGIQAGNLSSGFSASSGADGWALAVSSTQLFNVAHHSATLVVACHNQNNAASCWNGTKTVTDPDTGDNYATAEGAGLYLNQTNGRLYVYVVRASDQTAGVACIDTTKPASATGAQLFCGFTLLSALGDAPITGNGTLLQSGLSAPVKVGNSWYAFNGAVGTATGTRNTLLCFDLVAAMACASQPYALSFGGLSLTTAGTGLPIGASGSDVFIPVSSSTVNNLACFNTTTKLACTGSWPQAISAVAGSPFPLLDSSGTATGVCLPITNNPCYSLAGVSTPTPTGMGVAIGLNATENGPAAVINNSIYVPSGLTGKVGCYNYTTRSGCPNFPKQLSIFLLYTVNPDPQRPTCLWVNSNGQPGGSNQIQNLDAVTGQPCTQGFLRIPASSLINSAAVCQPTAYLSLQLVNPARSTYTTATVGFQDAQGNSLGIADQSLNSFGAVDLSGLGLAGTNPTFVIRFSGLTSSPANFNYRLSWTAAYSTVCTSSGQSVNSVPGYWMVASDGGIFNYGAAGFYGSAGAIPLNKPIVGIAALPNRGGYWLVASDGGIFNYGLAKFYGSTGNIALNNPIVGMASTPTGRGYWLVASDGGIFAYGDAAFYGSTGNIHLNKPIVSMAATQDGGGYWLVASDGGVFAYGDAAFYGSTGNISLNKPIVGMAANPNGGGYWMVASDGGIFAFGNSGFFGSTGNISLNKPIVGMASSFDAKGYWLVASDGGIFSFGDAAFEGSAGSIPLNKPIVGMAA